MCLSDPDLWAQHQILTKSGTWTEESASFNLIPVYYSDESSVQILRNLGEGELEGPQKLLA